MGTGLAINGTVFAIVAIAIVVIALGWYATTRLVVVPPNQAIIRAGRGNSAKPQIFTSGIVPVWPFIHKVFYMSLEQRQVDLEIEGPDNNFINTRVLATLNFKFDDSPEGMAKAVQRFLTHSEDRLEESVTKSAEGVLRAIISAMSVEEANNDRQAFQDRSMESAVTQFAEQGIQIDALNISSVTTPPRMVVGSDGMKLQIDYLDEIGRPRLETAKREANIATSKAFAESEAARIAQEGETAALERDLTIKKAEFKTQQDAAQAIADAATDKAKAQQDVEIAKLQTLAKDEEAKVMEKQLDIEIHKPADAQAYKLRVEAEAQRDAEVFRANARADARVIEAEGAKKADIAGSEARAQSVTIEAEGAKKAAIADAQALAESKKLDAEAESTAVNLRAEADANAVRLHGEAEGESIAAIGKATADAENAKALALTVHTQQSLAYLALNALPQIVQSSSEAVSGIDNYTVVSSDGASDAVKQGHRVVTESLAMLQSTTGIDLTDIAGLVGGLIAPKAETPASTASAPAAVDEGISSGPFDEASDPEADGDVAQQ